MIYNPAFIHFGLAITLNCLIRLRYDKKSKGFSLGRVFSSIFLVLSVGFILQLHYSWTVMAAVCGIMWLRRDIKISYLRSPYWPCYLCLVYGALCPRGNG